jgi:hypothetical protein
MCMVGGVFSALQRAQHPVVCTIAGQILDCTGLIRRTLDDSKLQGGLSCHMCRVRSEVFDATSMFR